MIAVYMLHFFHIRANLTMINKHTAYSILYLSAVSLGRWFDIAYRHITRTRRPGIVGMDCAGSTGVIGNTRSDHGLDYLHADKLQWVETPSGTGGTAVPHC